MGVNTISEDLPLSPKSYPEYIDAIDKNPFDEQVWHSVVALAKSEEGTAKAESGYYGRLPLNALLSTAERLRDTKVLSDQYAILAEQSPTGEFWYDVVLGRVNNKVLAVMVDEIDQLKDLTGLPYGTRHWDKAVDIGTGTGNSLEGIQKLAQQVVGVDHASFLLEQARTKPELAKSSLVVGEALQLPLADASVDLVTSSGLTAYLGKHNLLKFVGEVSRILEPGGSYVQAYAMGPEDSDRIAEIDKEYATSGKAVLVCLMDRLVTHRFMDKPGEPSEFSLLTRAFQRQGFSFHTAMDKERGVAVLEFKKPYSDYGKDIKSEYTAGAHEAASLVYDYLYGDAAMDIEIRDTVHPEKLPPKEQITARLREFRLLASDPEVVDWSTYSDYLTVFVTPLTDVAQVNQLDPEIRAKVVDVLANNLTNVEFRLNRSPNPEHWEAKGTLKYLKSLKSALEDKPWCADATSVIQRILTNFLQTKIEQ